MFKLVIIFATTFLVSGLEAKVWQECLCFLAVFQHLECRPRFKRVFNRTTFNSFVNYNTDYTYYIRKRRENCGEGEYQIHFVVWGFCLFTRSDCLTRVPPFHWFGLVSCIWIPTATLQQVVIMMSSCMCTRTHVNQMNSFGSTLC